jgi:hypothetical protein
VVVVVDQRNLTAKASIADIAEMENDRRESVVKLGQANGLSTIMVHNTRISSSTRSRPGGMAKMLYEETKKV